MEEPLPADDPKVRQPDISKARAVLGWEPRVDRREGLARTVAFFQDKLRRDELPEPEASHGASAAA